MGAVNETQTRQAVWEELQRTSRLIAVAEKELNRLYFERGDILRRLDMDPRLEILT